MINHFDDQQWQERETEMRPRRKWSHFFVKKDNRKITKKLLQLIEIILRARLWDLLFVSAAKIQMNVIKNTYVDWTYQADRLWFCLPQKTKSKVSDSFSAKEEAESLLSVAYLRLMTLKTATKPSQTSTQYPRLWLSAEMAYGRYWRRFVDDN